MSPGRSAAMSSAQILESASPVVVSSIASASGTSASALGAPSNESCERLSAPVLSVTVGGTLVWHSERYHDQIREIEFDQSGSLLVVAGGDDDLWVRGRGYELGLRSGKQGK